MRALNKNIYELLLSQSVHYFEQSNLEFFGSRSGGTTSVFWLLTHMTSNKEIKQRLFSLWSALESMGKQQLGPRVYRQTLLQFLFNDYY